MRWSFAHTRAHRQGRQHLGRRQGLGHDRQVQPGGPRRDGVRPQEGSVGRSRRRGRTSTRRCRRSTAMFRQPTDVTWDSAGQHLHQRRLHQLARRQVRQERRLGEVVGRAGHRAGRSSTRRTASRPTRKDNIYVADRGNRRIQVFDTDGKFLREITIDVPVPPDAQPAIGNTPTARRGRHAGDRRAVGDLHHARAEPGAVCCRTRSRAASTSCRSTARCSACSARPGKQPKQFGWIHEIACPSENELYVGRGPELARAEADAASGEEWVGAEALTQSTTTPDAEDTEEQSVACWCAPRCAPCLYDGRFFVTLTCSGRKPRPTIRAGIRRRTVQSRDSRSDSDNGNSRACRQRAADDDDSGSTPGHAASRASATRAAAAPRARSAVGRRRCAAAPPECSPPRPHPGSRD